MKKTKNRGGVRISLDITNVRFKITDDQPKKQIRGEVSFHVERWEDGHMKRDFDVTFQLLSAWQFPHKNAIVKAHLVHNPYDGYQQILMRYLNEIGEVPIGASETRAESGLAFSLMADANILRYGRMSGSSEDGIRIYDQNNRINLYDSKSRAFNGIITAMKSFKTLGGYRRINFNLIPDNVLESIGFSKMPDILRRGIPMWRGNPESATIGTDNYISRDRENVNRESLLEMIQAAIAV
jgi:hypothetical protein